MANLLKIREQFALSFANDPDADRHGIVDAAGLMNPNHFLCVCGLPVNPSAAVVFYAKDWQNLGHFILDGSHCRGPWL